MRAIGLMSGTSLDGIDAALVEITPRALGYALELVRFHCEPFDDAFRARLLAALPPNGAVPSEVASLDGKLGDRFTAAAVRVAGGEPVDYVASHGLTLFHRGEVSRTMQIGDPYRLRDAICATVTFDFRRADCALGGNGAPLVPYVDGLLFASAGCDTVAVNLGGIANVTVLRRGGDGANASAWDTGPANMVIDAFVASRTSGAQTFDRDGAFAAKGSVDENVLAELIAREAFFLMIPPPKSTGRERFGESFLSAHADRIDALSLEDGCATLAAFTAATVTESLARYAPNGARVIASGGGTHNLALMGMLRERLARTSSTLHTSDEFGVPGDAKEAMAFAVIGYETLRGRPASLPGATGARRPAVLGAIAPFELRALLAKMDAEVSANARV